MKYRNYEVAYRKLYKEELPKARKMAEHRAQMSAQDVTKRLIPFLEVAFDVTFDYGMMLYHLILKELEKGVDAMAEIEAAATAHKAAMEEARYPGLKDLMAEHEAWKLRHKRSNAEETLDDDEEVA